MSTILKFDPSGIKQMEDNLRRIAEQAILTGKVAVKEASAVAYERAYESVPRDTGALANSLYRDTEVTTTTAKAVVGHGGAYNQINPVTEIPTDSYVVERHETFYPNSPHGSKWIELSVRESEGDMRDALERNFRALFATGMAPTSDLSDTENRVDSLNIEGSSAYAYRESLQRSLENE